MNNIELKEIKKLIENMNKNKHIEILTIFKEHNVSISENKNGSFINLSLLNEEIPTEIEFTGSFQNIYNA